MVGTRGSGPPIPRAPCADTRKGPYDEGPCLSQMVGTRGSGPPLPRAPCSDTRKGPHDEGPIFLGMVGTRGSGPPLPRAPCSDTRKGPHDEGPCFSQMVGTRGFEPPTPCTPCRCASQTALRPEHGDIIGHDGGKVKGRCSPRPSMGQGADPPLRSERPCGNIRPRRRSSRLMIGRTAPSTSGLGRSPLKAKTRVRIPLGLPDIEARLLSRPSWTGRGGPFRVAWASAVLHVAAGDPALEPLVRVDAPP